MSRIRMSCVSLGLSLLLCNCSTSYQPRPSPRVATVIHRGSPYFVTGGQERRGGMAAGGLRETVAGDPEALAHASIARTQLLVGWPAYLLGLGAVVAGIAIAGPVGLAVAGTGAVSMTSGVALAMTAQTHVTDAVNIHNDNVTRTAEVAR